jgi:hypothetical protein
VVTTPIRILIAEDVPQLVGDLISSAFADDPRFTIVAPDDATDLGLAAEEAKARCVIVGLDESDLPPAAQTYLDERGGLSVVGVEAGDGTAVLYKLLPARAALGPVSPRELVDEIRKAVEAEG